MPLEDWTSLEPVKFIIENEDPATLIIIKLTYEFCGGCAAVQPAYLDLMVKHEKYARWMQLEVFKAKGATPFFNVKKVPTFVAIKNKIEVGRYVGTRRHTLTRFIEDMITTYGFIRPGVAEDDIHVGFEKEAL